MSLHNDVRRFDGKSIAVLRDIKASTPAEPEVLDALTVMTGDEDEHVQTAASWLIRAYLEDGAELTPDHVRRLASNLSAMHDGFGRLHVCQAMDFITVPREQAETFAAFFRSCRATKNTFLRAWAPHGFFQLALRHEQYQDEARAMIENALADPAASVRARARNTLKGA